MPELSTFTPDWASAPGETILDILTERAMTVSEFAHRMNRDPESIPALLSGRETISLHTARQLVTVLGSSVEFWMARDCHYRQDLERMKARERQWLDRLPLADMVRFSWLSPAPTPGNELNACLRYFNVPSIAAWHKRYAAIEEMAAFRTSETYESRPEAVATWLRQGELEADRIPCSNWDPKRFEEVLPSLRALSRIKDPQRFVPELQEHCGQCGVAVAIVRAPSGCRASGATRFLSETKALLLLSFRYRSDDHFWFTFFHESGHLLLHGRNDLFLEGSSEDLLAEENEANSFAANMLIPIELQPELLRLPADERQIIRFARKIGVSPGIVVGQLQYRKKLRFNQFNTLKRRIIWDD